MPGGSVEPASDACPEVEPAVAIAVFGDAIDRARQYARMLVTEGERRGLIGPSELSRLWTRHLLNSAVLAPLVISGRLGDVGSGAGLPGLPLAICRPDVTVVLIEPMERRVEWLRFCVDELELRNVEIIRARAEDAAPMRLDQVTARAVKPLRVLLPWLTPLLRSGGEVLLLKGRNAEQEIEDAQKIIRGLALRDVHVVEAGTGVVDPPSRVIVGRRS